MPFVEDLDIFFEDFQEEILIDGQPVIAIFDKATEIGEINTPIPFITIKTADIPAAKSGDAVVIRSQNFTIQRIEDDGTGISVVYLHGTASRVN